MSRWHLVICSLLHHWRINLAVALGVAAATAVLTGALVVGDSVRGSLRQLTLDRLGRIDDVLVVDRFVRVELAEEVAAASAFSQYYSAAVPAVLFPQGVVENPTGSEVARAAGVFVVGCDESFWQQGGQHAPPKQLPSGDEIILNTELADEIGAQVGDLVTLRLTRPHQVPGDSTFGRRDNLVRGVPQLRVVDIIPTAGLGRFSLQSSQNLPRNAYVATELLQQALGQEQKINAILAASSELAPRGRAEAEQANEELNAALQPKLVDYGFQLIHVTSTYIDPQTDEAKTAFEYFNLTTDRMVFTADAARTIQNALAARHVQPAMTYLANAISVSGAADDAVIPYSTITALENSPKLGPLIDAAGNAVELSDGEIALNSWAAEDLNAKLGDQIVVRYYEPETTDSDPKELSATFTLAAIIPIRQPAEPYRRRRPAEFHVRPTLANDPHLTPEVEGVTDQDTINDWDPPFPTDKYPIRSQDDDYWSYYRTTPKAFITMSDGSRLWSSRFGALTSFRIPIVDGVTETDIETAVLAQLRRDQVNLGLEFQPVKLQGLQASSGTTPFDVLFLSLSFFIIFAALLLVALLFRLGFEQRATEVGTLLAVGVNRKLTRRLLTYEGVCVCLDGALLGTILGIGYAWLMLVGLRTWWLGAISTPFLQLHFTWISLVVGFLSGVVVSILSIAWSLRQTRQISIRRLMNGQTTEEFSKSGRGTRLARLAAGGCFLVAILLAIAATQVGGEAQAGAFVGAGALFLASSSLWIGDRLQLASHAASSSRLSLSRLAWRNAARNPRRSTLTIVLMSTACFLIIAMSSFRLAPSTAGAGGFNMMAESSTPLFHDFATEDGLRKLFADEPALSKTTLLPLRLKAGDDASCNNLYKSSQPQVIGITPEFIDFYDAPRPGFSFAGSSAQSEQAIENPWHVLTQAPVDDRVPVVIDKNTAMYSLKLYKGIGEEFERTYDSGKTVRFRVAGLLSNSIFQGSLMVSEANLQKHFPEVSGYRLFLVNAPGDTYDAISRFLEDRFGDQGFDAYSTEKRLEDLLAVQNTYLSTFQSLGALGLLFGVFGLATVQLRSVLERRGELALLQAVGLHRTRLAGMVLLENVYLLLAGLVTGIAAALLAVVPHMIFGGAHVPLRDLMFTLGVVFVVGLLASFASVRATLTAALVPALRDR